MCGCEWSWSRVAASTLAVCLLGSGCTTDSAAGADVAAGVDVAAGADAAATADAAVAADVTAPDGSVVLANSIPDPCGHEPPLVARIDVSERHDVFHPTAFARLEAAVRDGVPVVVHDVVLEEGGCRYYELAFGSCPSPCAGAELCDAADRCRAEPAGVAAGRLTVRGLRGAPVAVDAESWRPGIYTSPPGLPADLFDDSARVQAELAGDGFPAASLTTPGVAPMDRALTDTGYVMAEGADASFTWTAGPDPEACVQLVLLGRNVIHGAPLADIIVCEGLDTGELVVPRALVERFPAGDTPDVTEGFDWPHSQLTRYRRTSLQTDRGDAALIVRSTTYFKLSHPEGTP